MESKFTIKDSGARQEFDTGSRRDTDEGKPRLSLIPPMILSRLAMVYTNGAKKYGDNNWQKGQPLSRYYDSAMRHLLAAAEGCEDEDHLFQAAWNAAAIAWTLEEIRAGRLPRALADMPYRLPELATPEMFLGPDPIPPNPFGTGTREVPRAPTPEKVWEPVPKQYHPKDCVCSICPGSPKTAPALEDHSGDADGYSRAAPAAINR